MQGGSCSLCWRQLKCLPSPNSWGEVNLVEDAPHASWKRDVHGFAGRGCCTRKPCSCGAAGYAHAPHGRAELAPVPSKQDAATNCCSGALLSHPLCHGAAGCQSHSLILAMRVKFLKKSIPHGWLPASAELRAKLC